MDLEELKYPIGRFEYGKQYSYADTKKSIKEIGKLPLKLEQIILKLSSAQMDQSYRPGAWTARQLINHLGDVYIHGYIRTKWLLTEDSPTIKTYDGNAFAILPDSKYLVSISLNIIANLIHRWVFLLMAIPETDYKRNLYHPEQKIAIGLDELIAMYAWHGNHHLAHLEIILGNNTK